MKISEKEWRCLHMKVNKYNAICRTIENSSLSSERKVEIIEYIIKTEE